MSTTISNFFEFFTTVFANAFWTLRKGPQDHLFIPEEGRQAPLCNLLRSGIGHRAIQPAGAAKTPHMRADARTCVINGSSPVAQTPSF